MSTTKKVLIAIFSILLIGAFVFLLTWGIINFNKVKEGMSGAGLYTKDDVDNAYNDGYNTALKDKEEYANLINSYKDTITLQTDTISQLNSEKSALDKSIKECQTQVDNLTSQRDAIQIQVDLLKEQIADKDGTIEDMTAEKQELIEQHTQTITRLNAQITGLNSQIEELNTQIQVNINSVSQLNNRIAELQRTIAFYEQFIGQFETDEQAMVTFEFAGSVYEVKVVNKGDKVTVNNPASTEYLIFNGWMLDGEPLDLSTYTVTQNVRIIADVTYKYIVNFNVDGNTKFTQVIEKGNCAEEPSSPRKNGYRFKYWTLDGETEVHFDQLPIMANTTFIAKFVQLHKVDFLYENGEQIINTKSVEHGQTTTAPRMSLNEGEVLNGWRINGNLVDVSTYVINEDTTFVVDITRKYKVVFMVDGAEYNTQFVESGKTAIIFAPSKEGYSFLGWYIDNADEIIDVDNFAITSDVTFNAKLRGAYLVTIYDRDTCLYNEYHAKGETVVFDVEPLGREGYIFTGFYDPVYDKESETCSVETPNRTLILDAHDYNLRAYYSVACAGYFSNGAILPDENGNLVFNYLSFIDIGYDQKNIAEGGIGSYKAINVEIHTFNSAQSVMLNWTAMRNSENYDLKKGTFKYQNEGGRDYFQGEYRADTDAWVFWRMSYWDGSYVKSVEFEFTRKYYSMGTFDENLLK